VNGRSTWAVVLAAGLSRRFGAGNKLTAIIGGVPLVRRTVTAYIDADLDGVIVVTGHDHEGVASALDGLPLTVVLNPGYAGGQSTSLRTGISALPAAAQRAIIGVGDQPFLSPSVIHAIAERAVATDALIVAPRYAGVRGNPVLFHHSLFDELSTVVGDTGGRDVIARHAGQTSWIDLDDPLIGSDVDTPGDLPTG
jgi:molybdenum cofactor cytidylyltransferase